MPPAFCSNHTETKEDLARANSELSHLRDEDSRTATAVLALEAKVDRINDSLQRVEKRLAYYAGGLAVAMVVLTIAMKLWTPIAPARADEPARREQIADTARTAGQDRDRR